MLDRHAELPLLEGALCHTHLVWEPSFCRQSSARCLQSPAGPRSAVHATPEMHATPEVRERYLWHLHKLREQALRDGGEVVAHQAVVAPTHVRSALP